MTQHDYWDKPLKEWPLGYLKSAFIGLCDSIDVVGCFSAHDVSDREAIASEIERRGYDIVPSTKYKFAKR